VSQLYPAAGHGGPVFLKVERRRLVPPVDDGDAQPQVVETATTSS
jgi:hypothetical protein